MIRSYETSEEIRSKRKWNELKEQMIKDIEEIQITTKVSYEFPKWWDEMQNVLNLLHKKDNIFDELMFLLKELGYEGPDYSLDISLMEYDFVYHEKLNRLIFNLGGEEFDNNNECFGYYILTEKAIRETFEEYKEGILDMSGMSEDDYSLVNMIDDIKAYIGFQNWIPSCYEGLLSGEELLEKLKVFKI